MATVGVKGLTGAVMLLA